jgi:hypothetical protein
MACDTSKLRAMTGDPLREYLQKAELCDEEPIKSPSRLRINWPAFAVGLGLVATLVWVVFLGWLFGRVVRLIP